MKGLIVKTNGGEIKMEVLNGYLVIGGESEKTVETEPAKPVYAPKRGTVLGSKRQPEEAGANIICRGSKRKWSKAELLRRQIEAVNQNKKTRPHLCKDGTIRYQRNKLFDESRITEDTIKRSENASKSWRKQEERLKEEAKIIDADVEEAESILEKAEESVEPVKAEVVEVEEPEEYEGLAKLNQDIKERNEEYNKN